MRAVVAEPVGLVSKAPAEREESALKDLVEPEESEPKAGVEVVVAGGRLAAAAAAEASAGFEVADQSEATVAAVAAVSVGDSVVAEERSVRAAAELHLVG